MKTKYILITLGTLGVVGGVLAFFLTRNKSTENNGGGASSSSMGTGFLKAELVYLDANGNETKREAISEANTKTWTSSPKYKLDTVVSTSKTKIYDHENGLFYIIVYYS